MFFKHTRAFLFFALSIVTLAACKEECPPGTMMSHGKCHPLKFSESDAGTETSADGGRGGLAQRGSGVSEGQSGSGDAKGTRGGRAAAEADAGTSITDAGRPSFQPGMSAPPRCGNDIVEGAEKCDGNCPTADDCPAQRDPCVLNVIQGDASKCDAVCSTKQIAICASGDRCCPMGCDFGSDSDCSMSCGDGLVEAPETCEPTSADMNMRCNTECDDGDPCTSDLLTGSAMQCNVRCTSSPVTSPMNGDNCCPKGANANNDNDCSATCGNHVKEGNESCDGDCPSADDCDDGDPCTTDLIIGSAERCSAKCTNTPNSSERCLVVPSGWMVGAVVSDTETCPSGFDSGEVLHRGLSTHCSDTCSCSAPAPGGCIGSFTANINDSSGSSHTYSGSANSQGTTACGSRLDSVPSSGTLSSISADKLSWVCAGSGATCSGCTASGTSQATAVWSDSIRFCPATASTLTCRDGSKCLEPAAQTCVMREGAAECPDGFPKAQPPAYAEVSGSAACTCSGCGSAASSQNCNSASWTFTYGSCSPTANVVAMFSSSGGSTSTFSSPAPDGLELSAFIQGEASAGMCNASSAVATRQFSTGDTRTVCCTR